LRIWMLLPISCLEGHRGSKKVPASPWIIEGLRAVVFGCLERKDCE